MEGGMDDNVAGAIKAELNKALTGVGPSIGILFGLELFAEFRKRKWLSVEKWGALGSTLFEARIPTYGQTHPVTATWDIPEAEFKVGKDASKG
jgi:hypothetical protein